MRKYIFMQRAILYFIAGTAISFLLNHFLLGSQGWQLDLYYGAAFGATWEISEATAGGSNVSLTLCWNTSQQNAAFDSGTAKVGHYLNGNWAEENSGSVLNNNITATGISSFSPFAVMNFGALAASDFSKSKVLIYPNPFNENLNISTENGGVVNFYDLSGKLVSTSVLMKGTNSLNKSSLAKGVYIYQIKNANDEILSSGKIIKK